MCLELCPAGGTRCSRNIWTRFKCPKLIILCAYQAAIEGNTTDSQLCVDKREKEGEKIEREGQRAKVLGTHKNFLFFPEPVAIHSIYNILFVGLV